MPQASTMPSSISPDSYAFLQRWIHISSGIVLDAHKSYLLESRLAPVIEREGMRSIDDLCMHLRQGTPGLSRKVVEAMTTHETLFFRDTTPFEILRKTIVPQLLVTRPRGHKINIWSAAASSGQEAYSLAMILIECGVAPGEVSILGTDLSEKVLERARLATYGKFEVSRGLPADYLARYFQLHHDANGLPEYQLRDIIRQMVRFEPLDLRANFRGRGPFDIIFCRNVLIYFDTKTKEDILREMRSVMSRGSFLLLGAAETIGSVEGFQRVHMDDAIAYVSK
ncbi:protein-glutamate O-methyltransferase CheR [Terriglobus sp. RCC_193]|uniref:CheR family methyltransferase n=1 Tax=Terriglobus sp. RCC_193 TaxID=3239218 RepID=UPI0035246CDE